MPTDIISQHTIPEHFNALNIRHLSSQEEAYVMHCARGLNPSAAARSAGYPKPADAVAELSVRHDICKAIAYFREMTRQAALSSGAIDFTKDDATLLYLEAHAKSITATEEIKAVDSLVRLHGLAAPEKKEIKVTSRDELESLDSEELLKLSGSTINLNPEEYSEVEDR